MAATTGRRHAFICSAISRSPKRRLATTVPQARSAGATFSHFYDGCTSTRLFDDYTLT
jgi:hypothetical protein